MAILSRPMIGAITGYEIGNFVHVLAVVLAFGPTFAYSIFAATAMKTEPRSVPTILRGIVQVDRFLVTPGMIVVLLAGIYLLAEGDISAGESWVSVGFVAILVLFAMAGMFFAPRNRRALELAERDLEKGDQLGPEFEALTKQIAIGGQVAALIVIVTIFFMVVKP